MRQGGWGAGRCALSFVPVHKAWSIIRICPFPGVVPPSSRFRNKWLYGEDGRTASQVLMVRMPVWIGGCGCGSLGVSVSGGQQTIVFLEDWIGACMRTGFG